MNQGNSGINWDDQTPQENQPEEFEDFYRDTHEKRVRLGDQELLRERSGTIYSSDGRHGQSRSGSEQILRDLACGHVFSTEGTLKVMRTPGGALVCQECYKLCGHCQHVIEPLPGERIFIQFTKRLYHRECAFLVARTVLVFARIGKIQIADQAEKLQLVMLYETLKREHPGLLRQFKTWLVGNTNERDNSRELVRRDG